MNPRSLLRILVSRVLVLALMLAWLLYQSHGTAVQRAIDDADNLSQVLEGQFTAILRRIDSNLHSLALQLPPVALNRQAVAPYQRQVDTILQSYTRNFPEVGAYFVWDAEGGHL